MTFVWLVHRRMWWPAGAYLLVLVFFLPGVAAVLSEHPTAMDEAYLLVGGLLWVLPAMFGNALYHLHCRTLVLRARITWPADDAEQIRYLRANGGVSSRRLVIEAAACLALLVPWFLSGPLDHLDNLKTPAAILSGSCLVIGGLRTWAWARLFMARAVPLSGRVVALVDDKEENWLKAMQYQFTTPAGEQVTRTGTTNHSNPPHLPGDSFKLFYDPVSGQDRFAEDSTPYQSACILILLGVILLGYGLWPLLAPEWLVHADLIELLGIRLPL